MILYKLTDDADISGDYTTPLQWGPGVEHRASGKGELCGPGWIHAYEHPLLAVLHNPIHKEYYLGFGRLWECETEDEYPLKDGQLQLGVRRLRTVKQINMPQVTPEQRISYGILCAKAVCTDSDWWHTWADNWLSDIDRSAAKAAAWALRADEWAAWTELKDKTEEKSAAWTAAARAAEAAATSAAKWTPLATRATWTTRAAEAAAWAAAWATRADEGLDLLKIAIEATTHE